MRDRAVNQDTPSRDVRRRGIVANAQHAVEISHRQQIALALLPLRAAEVRREYDNDGNHHRAHDHARGRVFDSLHSTHVTSTALAVIAIGNSQKP